MQALTVFKVIAGHTIRYVRALSSGQAKARAVESFGFKPLGYKRQALNTLQAYPIGNYAPHDYGALGYDEESKVIEKATDSRTLRAMQKGGQDQGNRSGYVIKEANKTKQNNKALEFMRELGLI
ncbi:MAG TPA: hypothetical protein VLA25_04340 [Methylotenera sp.]|nr:hypothetical protein [Methylotenera sp.]